MQTARARKRGAFMAAQASPSTHERIALIDMIRAGLTVKMVDDAASALGLSFKDLADYGVIAPRTLTHSRKSGKFSPTQSNRVARFFRVFRWALDTFGSADKAKTWLNRPTRALGERAPADLLDTEEGARLVEDLLFRIDHGMAT